MKILGICLLVGILIFTVGLSISFAQPHQNGPNNYQNGQNDTNNGPHKNNQPSVSNRLKAKNYTNEQQARSVLKRTAQILTDAQVIAHRSGRYFGLGLAINHQQYAQRLFRSRRFDEAINHSLRARQLAEDILRSNHGWNKNKYGWNSFENDRYHRAPPTNQLDLIIRNGAPNDKAALTIHINLNF